MSKKSKFQLGDYVTYSNKRNKYSYVGQIIAKEGRYCIVEIISSTDSDRIPCKGHKEIHEYGDWLPEKFTVVDYVWTQVKRTVSNQCVWDSSRYLHHAMKPYEAGQNGDTDDDI